MHLTPRELNNLKNTLRHYEQVTDHNPFETCSHDWTTFNLDTPMSTITNFIRETIGADAEHRPMFCRPVMSDNKDNLPRYITLDLPHHLLVDFLYVCDQISIAKENGHANGCDRALGYKNNVLLYLNALHPRTAVDDGDALGDVPSVTFNRALIMYLHACDNLSFTLRASKCVSQPNWGHAEYKRAICAIEVAARECGVPRVNYGKYRFAHLSRFKMGAMEIYPALPHTWNYANLPHGPFLKLLYELDTNTTETRAEATREHLRADIESNTSPLN